MKKVCVLLSLAALVACSRNNNEAPSGGQNITAEFLAVHSGEYTTGRNSDDDDIITLGADGSFESLWVRQVGSRDNKEIPYPTVCKYTQSGKVEWIEKRRLGEIKDYFPEHPLRIHYKINKVSIVASYANKDNLPDSCKNFENSQNQSEMHYTLMARALNKDHLNLDDRNYFRGGSEKQRRGRKQAYLRTHLQLPDLQPGVKSVSSCIYRGLNCVPNEIAEVNLSKEGMSTPEVKRLLAQMNVSLPSPYNEFPHIYMNRNMPELQRNDHVRHIEDLNFRLLGYDADAGRAEELYQNLLRRASQVSADILVGKLRAKKIYLQDNNLGGPNLSMDQYATYKTHTRHNDFFIGTSTTTGTRVQGRLTFSSRVVSYTITAEKPAEYDREGNQTKPAELKRFKIIRMEIAPSGGAADNFIKNEKTDQVIEFLTPAELDFFVDYNVVLKEEIK